MNYLVTLLQYEDKDAQVNKMDLKEIVEERLLDEG